MTEYPYSMESTIMRVIIKPIIPSIHVPDFQKIAKTELRREVVAVKRELALPTKRFKHTVEFYETQAPGAASSGIEVATKDKVYNILDGGAKPHIIKPKKAKMLAFNSVFKAKTKPESLNSGAGRNSPPVAFARVVHHPGIKPRNWKKIVLKRSRKRFPANVDKAVRRAVARANRG